jgi:dinuclear metal center YbgI/SA1388 family protein
MAVTVSDLAKAVEDFAPLDLAEPWDRPGLQVGDPGAAVRSVLVTLDPSPAALREALHRQAQVLVTHHPLYLAPPARLDLSQPLPALLAALIRANIAAYAAHTNLDRAEGGVNDALARALGLQDLSPLGSGEAQCKIAVTVPAGYEEPVRQALASAGAGRIGRYAGCSFGCRGQGSFSPLPGATPFLGAVGRAERVDETRLEVNVARSRLPRALAELGRAHPYEEPAVDVYPLEVPCPLGALGRVGTLPAGRALGTWAREVAASLGAPSARLVGDPGRRVTRVAVCGGSGSEFWKEALAAGADVLVTGDVKYHTALEAREWGLALLDLGHGPTEQVAVDVLAERLGEWARGAAEDLEVHVHREPDPFVAVVAADGSEGRQSGGSE